MWGRGGAWVGWGVHEGKLTSLGGWLYEMCLSAHTQCEGRPEERPVFYLRKLVKKVRTECVMMHAGQVHLQWPLTT